MSGPRVHLLAGLVGLLMATAGCATSGLSAVNYGMRQVQDTDRPTLMAAAEAALVNAGYPIDRVDAASGSITSQPLPGVPGGPESFADERDAPGRLRRIAHVRIAQKDDAWNVYCKVVIEEQVTESYRMQQQLSFGDVPHETPIEREAATTAEQNTVWRVVRRDRSEEQRILDSIPARHP